MRTLYTSQYEYFVRVKKHMPVTVHIDIFYYYMGINQDRNHKENEEKN